MRSLIAHLRLFGRHGRSVWVGRYRWVYCNHRSHWLNLPCYRWFFYDGYCGVHNGDCWGECPTEK